MADDPGYIKKLKIKILERIASDENLGDILNELGEYVTDIDHEMAELSIKAMGSISMRLPSM